MKGDDTVVGRGNAGWTVSKSDFPAHARTAYSGFPQKRLERISAELLSLKSSPRPLPSATQLVKGLNWREWRERVWEESGLKRGVVCHQCSLPFITGCSVIPMVIWNTCAVSLPRLLLSTCFPKVQLLLCHCIEIIDFFLFFFLKQLCAKRGQSNCMHFVLLFCLFVCFVTVLQCRWYHW